MPLLPGKQNIGRNVTELEHSRTKAGRARARRPNAKQIDVAIALKKAGVPRKGAGGHSGAVQREISKSHGRRK
jgi:hypothetical protein